jgi:hypothetical protein
MVIITYIRPAADNPCVLPIDGLRSLFSRIACERSFLSRFGNTGGAR